MRWSDRIIQSEELNRYIKSGNGRSLVAHADALIAQQRAEWPLLNEGYVTLERIESHRIPVANSEVVAQHNPKRIRSTAAAVDSASVGKRPCFLCPENLPVEEKGIAYGGDLVILCNPYPILDKHLSIVHRDHIEQKIEGNFETLMSLAADLAPEFFVLYNGPRCGASAPDHLHFQACSRKLLPIESELRAGDPPVVEGCNVCEETRRDTFELFTLEGCGRSVVVFRGNDQEEIAGWFYRTLDNLPRADETAEPMLNLICTYEKGTYTICMFPRLRHRPACFFAKGDERLIVSPGAIDMAGVVVLPEREHYLKLSGSRMEAIYREVSYSEDEVNGFLDRVSSGAEAGW